MIYNTYLLPNNLTENEEFLANEAVPAILEALRKTNLSYLSCKHSSTMLTRHVVDISDPNGELAAQYTDYFLGDAVMGNLTSMVPGLVDVRIRVG